MSGGGDGNSSSTLTLLSVLDEPVDSPKVGTLLSAISDEPVQLTVKDFKSVSYRSSQEHGLSLQYEQQPSSNKWICRAVDVYNEGAVKGWSAFTQLPIEVDLSNQDGKELRLLLHKDTKGVDIVQQLGEPDRTGGGEPMKGGGASGLGPGAWMEWKHSHKDREIDVMIELAGQEARGSDRWEKERAGSASWGICTFGLRG
jgi:hypothetical protein